MRATMASDEPLLFVPVGSNPARLFGMDARDPACRPAINAGFECAEAAQDGRGALIANMAYAWDLAWLKALRTRPRSVLTLSGKPVIAHVPPDGDPAAVAAALEAGEPLEGFEALPAET